MAQRVKKVVLIETPEDPCIKGIGHKKGIPGKSLSGATPEMYVKFRNGTSFVYFGVPREVFDKALAAGRTIVAFITRNIGPFYASGHLLENHDVVFTWDTKDNEGGKMSIQPKPKPDLKWDWNVTPELPDGMRYDKETLHPSVECSQCGEWFEWPLDVAEYDQDVQENHYCGGSPRCCP